MVRDEQRVSADWEDAVNSGELTGSAPAPSNAVYEPTRPVEGADRSPAGIGHQYDPVSHHLHITGVFDQLLTGGVEQRDRKELYATFVGRRL